MGNKEMNKSITCFVLFIKAKTNNGKKGRENVNIKAYFVRNKKLMGRRIK
jgi:hypothetical protein